MGVFNNCTVLTVVGIEHARYTIEGKLDNNNRNNTDRISNAAYECYVVQKYAQVRSTSAVSPGVKHRTLNVFKHNISNWLVDILSFASSVRCRSGTFFEYSISHSSL